MVRHPNSDSGFVLPQRGHFLFDEDSFLRVEAISAFLLFSAVVGFFMGLLGGPHRYSSSFRCSPGAIRATAS